MQPKKRKKRRFQYKHKQKKSNKKKFLTAQKKQQQQLKKTTLFRKLINVICKPSKKVHFLIAIFAVIAGVILNEFDKMPLFGIKVFFGFALYLKKSMTEPYLGFSVI